MIDAVYMECMLNYRECSGSVVECLTRIREAAGSSLTGVTVLCPWSRTFSSLALVQPRKIHPFITERLLMQSNQTKNMESMVCIKNWNIKLHYCTFECHQISHNAQSAHACWCNKELYGCAHIQDIIHSLKLVDYLPVHMHKLYNSLHLQKV